MALTTDFSFQLGTSGFIINDNKITYPAVDLSEIQGLDSAPFRTSIRDRDGRDGGYVDSVYEQARTIVLSGVLYDEESNTETTLDRLKGEWAPSEVPLPLYMRAPKVGGRMLWVKPQGVRYSITQLRRLGMCEIQFNAIAGDPRIYSENESIKTMTVSNLIQTGVGFDRSFDVGFGGITVGSFPAAIVNAGNRSTPVKFRMYGPYINPHVVNTTTGDEMAFDILVDTTTDYLEIDSEARTVRFYSTAWGVSNVRDKLRRPSWFDLAPGTNSIQFNVEGGSAGATHMDIIYRSAWR
jgi:hypothetical protein